MGADRGLTYGLRRLRPHWPACCRGDAGRTSRPEPGEEPAAGLGETRRLRDQPRPGAGAAGAAAPAGDRAVRGQRARPVRRGVRGTDITCRSGGFLVDVGSRRPRAVPVLAGYHDPLLASAKFAGDRLITGGRDPGRNNVTTPLICSLAGGTGLPHLEASRLRATWLADCAALLGLATFMAAAGITCSQRLGDIIATLEPGGEAEAVALLGGTR